MTALAQFLMLSGGMTRLGIAFAAGAVSALSMPPLFVLPALFVGMSLLVWLLDGAEHKPGLRGRIFGPAFRIGWMYGAGYFLVSMHWIGFAFFIEPEVTAAYMVPAMLAGTLVLGLFYGFGAALAHSMWADGGHRIVALAAALTVTEWLRGHVLTGFPWNLPGYALTAADPMLQPASVIGVYGLTFIALLVAAAPALIWPADAEPAGRRLAPLVAGVGVLAGLFGFGVWRLAATEPAPVEGVRLRMVQPNIAQRDKWQPGRAEQIFQSLLDLSAGRTGPGDPGLEAVTHLVWPESVFPFIVADHPDALARIGRLLPPGTLLIAGAAREDRSAIPAADGTLPVFNSIVAINDVGEIVASYDKLRLVPFGEFVPFAAVFGALGLSELVGAQSNFAPRVGVSRPFALYGTPPVLPLICYEAIFSGDLGPGVEDAQWILNLTNDAWFAGSIGPAQHFHHARLRAVEEGLSLVRVANTGVTAMIDPLGRVLGRLPANQAGVLDAALSAPVNRTIFARYRSWVLAT
ncbi:MAG TPA: apolipoprotein N-acyltransferase, partial [Devosiaceae bacterium]|nr:apolipoprotein N-acyltransferase [Devosiaceae bacterium]